MHDSIPLMLYISTSKINGDRTFLLLEKSITKIKSWSTSTPMHICFLFILYRLIKIKKLDNAKQLALTIMICAKLWLTLKVSLSNKTFIDHVNRSIVRLYRKYVSLIQSADQNRQSGQKCIDRISIVSSFLC